MIVGNFSQNLNVKTSAYNYGSQNNQLTFRPKVVAFKGAEQKAAEVGTDVLLELAQKLAKALKDGKDKLVTDTLSLVNSGKVREAIGEMNKNIPPEGFVKKTQAGVELSTFNWDGSPITHTFKPTKGFKYLGVVDKADDKTAETLFVKAFGQKPKVSVGAVGWTVIKPENVKGGTSLTKAELSKAYQEGFNEFYMPVDNYFTKGLGIKPKDRVLTSCVNNSGIDEAVMSLGEKNKIPTMTVVPYVYGIYGKENHPHPTVFTKDIPGYVDLYSKMSDIIVVTGGRDHAFKYDAGGKWLNQNEGLVIPVDVLKDFKGIEVPSKINGKIENAAALAYETFESPFAPHLIEEFKNMPENSYKAQLKHPAQQALAAAMYRNISK